jgi:hypothetical protein
MVSGSWSQSAQLALCCNPWQLRLSEVHLASASLHDQIHEEFSLGRGPCFLNQFCSRELGVAAEKHLVG